MYQQNLLCLIIFSYKPGKNTYHLVDNDTGNSIRCEKNSDFRKKFNVELTGQVGYDERVKKAANVYKHVLSKFFIKIFLELILYAISIKSFTL